MKKNREAPIIIVRKRAAHDEHHGGAWKVAFADFMTAMFSLFLVLWLITQSSDIKSAIAGYFQDPLGRAEEYGSSIMPGNGAQTQSVRRVMDPNDVYDMSRDRLQSISDRLRDRFSDNKDLENHVEMTLTDEGLRIELLEGEEGYFFEKGVSTPTEAGRKVLALLSHELATLTLPIRVEGHTDANRYPDSAPYSNWELSADRANAARRILVQSGLPAEQIAQVQAYADRKPRPGTDPYSPRNRRVSIVMLVGTDKGKQAAADSTGAQASGAPVSGAQAPATGTVK
jgi:chemotaxis protein MotB